MVKAVLVLIRLKTVFSRIYFHCLHSNNPDLQIFVPLLSRKTLFLGLVLIRQVE